MNTNPTPFATNELITSSTDILDLLRNPNLLKLLKELDYDWTDNRFNKSAKIVELLNQRNFVEHDTPNRLNRMGTLFLSRLLLHFDPATLEKAETLSEKYADFKLISSGKNAFVFKARHIFLQNEIILKIVRPGASEDIVRSLTTLGKVDPDTALVLPIDYFEARVADILGKSLQVSCLVFPFVKGKTFREFLKQQNHHLNSQVAIVFSQQIGRALAELERVGAYHGDLHEQNILVDQYSTGILSFRIVDISFDAMGSLPGEVCKNNDLTNFKQHIWRIIAAQKASLPMISIRKYVGTRSYLKISEILSDSTANFLKVQNTLKGDTGYNQYITSRDLFINEKFSTPASFRLQRYEEITDPTVAVKLFVPFDELMSKIKNFGNIFVSGNRGSGKSTYLASLAFFPETSGSLIDSDLIFGIYFPCRQGEFKPLSTRPDWTPKLDRALITKLMIVKIVRTTLESVASGLGAGKFTLPSEIVLLKEFVARFVPPPGIVSVGEDVQSEIENLVSTMIRAEMIEMAQLGSAPMPDPSDYDLSALLEFFAALRKSIPQLSRTQFHLLFDDAGEPYVPKNVQAVMSDLMLLSNPIFCIKVSAEKLSFDFCSSDGKQLELGQDYLEHDISQMLFIGSDPSGLRRGVLERYFHRIVQERLEYFGYESTDIEDYLGDHQLTHNQLLDKLSKSRKDAHYCGWTTVWNIADRTPRNLLEIVSEIFSAGGIENHSPPNIVSESEQNRAIRTISEKRLDALSQISGAIDIHGKRMSLGRRLFEVTTVIGSTFRKYLRNDREKPEKRQHLAIERNDLGDLSAEANDILHRLITFGILDATKLEYSRDDQARKPIYVLNRIYCPIFGIGYRRDIHLRLSRKKFELLLIAPESFIVQGTERLRKLKEGGEEDLFNYRMKL